MGRPKHIYTKEQDDWIRENLVIGQPIRILAEKFNKKYGTDIQRRNMAGHINHALKINYSTYDGKFTKGHSSWNKGLKIKEARPDVYQKMKDSGTWFGPNNLSGSALQRYKQIGYIRSKDKDGFRYIKVRDEHFSNSRAGNTARQKNWKSLHHHIYEQAYGPVPEGYVIKFLDGNKENLALDNLAIVSRAELAVINRHRLNFKDKDLSATGINISKVILKTSQLRSKTK